MGDVACWSDTEDLMDSTLKLNPPRTPGSPPAPPPRGGIQLPEGLPRWRRRFSRNLGLDVFKPGFSWKLPVHREQEIFSGTESAVSGRLPRRIVWVWGQTQSAVWDVCVCAPHCVEPQKTALLLRLQCYALSLDGVCRAAAGGWEMRSLVVTRSGTPSNCCFHPRPFVYCEFGVI